MDREHNVVMSNKLIKSNQYMEQEARKIALKKSEAVETVIKGKQTMTLQVARLIRLVVSQVCKEDKDLRTYKISITDLCDILEIPKNNMYRDVQKLCVQAKHSHIYRGTENPQDDWQIMDWFSTVYYEKKTASIVIRLSEEIKPYVLDLNQYFTKYRLGDVLTLNSYYAIRLYELLLCDLGEKKYRTKDKNINAEEITYTITELRAYFDCENKLLDYNDFNRKVIKKAIQEINEKTEIYIMPIYNKRGRKVDSVTFAVSNNVITQENGIRVKNEYKYRCALRNRGIKFKSTTDDDVIQALENKKAAGV